MPVEGKWVEGRSPETHFPETGIAERDHKDFIVSHEKKYMTYILFNRLAILVIPM